VFALSTGDFRISGRTPPTKLRSVLQHIVQIADTWLAALPNEAKVYSVLSLVLAEEHAFVVYSTSDGIGG
jgi:hypothetical protein